MQTAYIKFNSESDRVRGFYELATRFRVSSLPDQIYSIPVVSLHHLDAQHIGYRRATDDEIAAANDKIRNPSALVL